MIREAIAEFRRDLTVPLFIGRALLACCIALYVAFSLQLQSPLSSVTTVLIVASPTNGAIVSKSLWRLFGTIVGAVVAVALMAWFAQSPVLYILVLSCCIGVACFVSSLLRFFKAYGAVLAGYTIILVSAGAFHAPTDIFIDALSRLSAVFVGLISAAGVYLLTALPRSSSLAGSIDLLLRDVAALFMRVRGPERNPTEDAKARAALLERIVALDEAIEYGAAESYELRRRRRSFRLAASRLLGLLSSVDPVHDALDHTHGVIEARSLGHAAMARVADRSVSFPTLVTELRATEQELGALAMTAPQGDAVLAALHERTLLEQVRRTILAMHAKAIGEPLAQRRIRLRPLPEWHAAARNAVRGFLVTLIAGLFWYVSQWPSGPSLLAYLIPASCLLAANPSASRASLQFAYGTLFAIPVALFCQSYLLPQVDGFPLLAASLCLCLAPGIWLQTKAKTRLMATGFSIFFCAMISVHNPITFNDITFFNTLTSFVIGPAMLIMVFRVLLPADVAGDARRFCRSLAGALQRLARRGAPGSGPALDRFEVWQDQQMQKVLRLEQRSVQLPSDVGRRTTRAAYLVLALGRAVASMRALRQEGNLPPDAIAALDRGLVAISHVCRDPARVSRDVSDAARSLPLPGMIPATIPTEQIESIEPEPDATFPADHEDAAPDQDRPVAADHPEANAFTAHAVEPLAPEEHEQSEDDAPALENSFDPLEREPGVIPTPEQPQHDSDDARRRLVAGLLDEAALLIAQSEGLLRTGTPILRTGWSPEGATDQSSKSQRNSAHVE